MSDRFKFKGDHIQLTPGRRWGIEVRGDVVREMDNDGHWHEAKGWDAIQKRQQLMDVFGPEISRAAGLEPE